MSQHPSRSPLTGESVAEFLADREGLVGGARGRFRRLLREYGGFKDISAAPRSRLPICGSLLLGLAGLMWDRPSQWSDSLVWIEYGVLSTGLIWWWREEECKSRHVDRETDWEAYRLFLRPVILSDHPGLLDRNAGHSGPGETPVLFRPLPQSQAFVHARGPDLWWATLLGLWGGLAALVVVHATGTTTRWMWSLAFPAGGLLLGLAAWFLWRRLVYALVKSDFRLTGR